MRKVHPCGCEVEHPGDVEDASRRAVVRFCRVHLRQPDELVTGAALRALTGKGRLLAADLERFVELGYLTAEEAAAILAIQAS